MREVPNEPIKEVKPQEIVYKTKSEEPEEVLKPKEVEVDEDFPELKAMANERKLPEEVKKEPIIELPARKHRKIYHCWDGMDINNKQLAVYYANTFLENFYENVEDGVGVINITHKVISLPNSDTVTHIFIEYYDYEILKEQPEPVEQETPIEEENEIETEPVAPKKKSIFRRKK